MTLNVIEASIISRPGSYNSLLTVPLLLPVSNPFLNL